MEGPPVCRSRRHLEQRVVEPLVVPAERVAGMDTLSARFRDDFGPRPSDPHGKLLECCLIGERKLESRVLEPPLRVAAEREAGLPQLAESLRPEPREVYQPGERQQGLVGGDVRRRLLAPDVLLARLEGEDIAALARGVYRLADDPTRHPADVRGAGGEEAVVRASVRLVVACTLALADRERAAVGPRRLQ